MIRTRPPRLESIHSRPVDVPQKKVEDSCIGERLIDEPICKSNPLVIPEVQKAMGRGWLTKDLISLVGTNSDLMSALNDEGFQQLLGLMKRDPRRAREILERDHRLSSMLRCWASVLGDHFESLSTKQSPDSIELIREARKTLSNDPEIQQLLALLSRGVKIDPREMASKNPALWKKVDRLIKSGLLRLNY